MAITAFQWRGRWDRKPSRPMWRFGKWKDPCPGENGPTL
jgi:hypothetical protein